MTAAASAVTVASGKCSKRCSTVRSPSVARRSRTSASRSRSSTMTRCGPERSASAITACSSVSGERSGVGVPEAAVAGRPAITSTSAHRSARSLGRMGMGSPSGMVVVRPCRRRVVRCARRAARAHARRADGLPGMSDGHDRGGRASSHAPPGRARRADAGDPAGPVVAGDRGRTSPRSLAPSPIAPTRPLLVHPLAVEGPTSPDYHTAGGAAPARLEGRGGGARRQAVAAAAALAPAGRASRMRFTAASSCAAETNHASKTDGGRFTPASSRAWKSARYRNASCAWACA